MPSGWPPALLAAAILCATILDGTQALPSTQPLRFRILVDVNTLPAADATGIGAAAADGAWVITHNSPGTIDWRQVLDALMPPGGTVISEDDPGETRELDKLWSLLGHRPDGAMFYVEDGLATPLDDRAIAEYAAHRLDGRDVPLGARIVVLTRSYADGDPRHAQLDRALDNPAVSGAALEFDPDVLYPVWKIGAACRKAVALNKRCFLLMPPSLGTRDYVNDLRHALGQLAWQGDILDNPNVFLVLAAYGGDTVHFLNALPGDRNSVQAAVEALKAYRQNPAALTMARPPPDRGFRPVGKLDRADCTEIAGWAYDPDTPDIDLHISLWIDGPAGSGTQAGQAVANRRRPEGCADTRAAAVDATAAAGCGHGFTWSLPARWRDGKAHQVWAYGIDTGILDSNNAALKEAPKTVQCPDRP